LEPTPDPDVLSERVDHAVLALRRLLYRSGTLVAGIKGSQPENDEILNTRLKPLQRKVTATLSKVVLSARAARFNPSFASATLGRVQQDARDLDRTVVKFVEEVERCNLPSLETRRITGVLLSGEGAAGVGIGLVGAGIGGGWKGLGYVPMEDAGPSRRLAAGLITEFQDQKAILDEKAQVLASCFATNDTLIVQEGKDAFNCVHKKPNLTHWFSSRR
jgi:son of sevenless-like protein